MRRFLIGLVLAFVPLCSVAETAALSGAWRPADVNESAASVHTGDPGLKAFDPARLTAFDGGANGSWVLLTPAAGPRRCRCP